MVVHGQIFSFDLPYENHVDLTDHHSMAGKAVLICRPNSHPFVDRTLSLDHPVKIGRSVARARAAQTNGIFDCKVLSRNHALIWYNNGKFYLQDTKSSNGTFVNNQRLSKSGEDSSPREVSSGDIVQFGVDVLENTRKVTHGCIVANLKLYLPDGKEAKASLSTSVISGFGSVSLEDLYELNQHIQEALQREQMLETKLAVLQQLVLSLKQAADVSWRALIAEDRLLSRVETLEYQLQTYANKNFAEDKLREELRKLQEEKSVYQGVSKECLQKVLQEKLEVVQKCQDIERSLLNAEQECSGYKEIMARNHAELQDLANKHTAQVLKIAELQTQLQETEEDCKEALARVELENEVLNSEMNRMLAKEAEMKKKIKQLEASGKIVGRQLLGIQTQFQLKRSPDIHDHINSLKEHNGDTEDVICKNNDEEELKEDKQKDINSSMDSLISRLTSEVDMQSNFKEFIVLTQAQISLLQEEKMSKLQQINSLEAEIELHVEKLYKYKEENKNLEQSLTSLEEKYKEENTNNMDTSLINSISVNGSEKLSDSPEPANVASLQAQMDELKEAIKESQSKVEAMERTINLLQEDLLSAKRSLNETTKNWLLQEEKLQKALTIKEHSDTTVNELCEHLKSLETSLMQAKLQEKIELESEHISKHKEETTLLRKQLLEAQQTAKQNKNEVELVKEKLRVVSAELEMSKSMTESSLAESQVDNKYAEELIAARLEAAALEARVASLEAQIKKLKLESNQRQQELEESNQAGTGTPEDKEVIIEKLRLRVNEMEEELVLVKEKYMACNEKNTQLEKKFSSLRQDYEAVVHQPYFVRHHYLLGLVLSIVIAILLSITLYPSS